MQLPPTLKPYSRVCSLCDDGAVLKHQRQTREAGPLAADQSVKCNGKRHLPNGSCPLRHRHSDATAGPHALNRTRSIRHLWTRPDAKRVLPVLLPLAIPSCCAGAHILYRAGPNHAPQHGRIIRTGNGTATITTTSATAEASAEQLAPYLPSGSEVMISVPSHPGAGAPHVYGVIDAPPGGLPPGRTIPATVLRDDSDTRWPPHYVVRLPDASSATVMHVLFTAVTMPPGAGGGPQARSGRFASPMAADAEDMPSAPPTLPGACPSRLTGCGFMACMI